MQPDDLLDSVREHDAEYVDLRSTTWTDGPQHRVTSVACLRPEELTAGIPHDHGRRLRPCTATAHLDPFAQFPTLAVICDLMDAAGAPAAECSRSIALRAAEHADRSGVGDGLTLSLRLQFHIFDQVSYAVGGHATHYTVESREGAWRRGRPEPDNHGLQIEPQRGTQSTPPADSLVNLRSEIASVMAASGVGVRGHRHGPGGAGHVEVELEALPIVAAGDAIVKARDVARNVAARHGKVTTFMPRPLANDAGSELTIRVQWPDAPPAGASQALDSAAMVLTALFWPTTNGYRGVSPGPSPLAGNVIQVDDTGVTVIADPTGDPYILVGALAMVASLGATTFRPVVPSAAPASLMAALDVLESNQVILATGDVLPPEFLPAYIAQKRAECARVSSWPHPAEFALYFAR